jgi:N6-L-threonylcarbamoyladenine synthase
LRILASEVASQAPVHAIFGGVVPEIASRQHTQCISQLTARVFEQGVGSRAPIHPAVKAVPHPKPVAAVAATIGPGLIGSLMVGVGFAKALAYAWRVPFIAVHHLEGHIYSVFLTDAPPELPFLALVVSGGHTCLIACNEPHQYAVLGATRDDAVGECFDKVARLLQLPYPGGPSIQKAAEHGNPRAIRFPRGLAGSGELEFSYSGLKTAVLYELRKEPGFQPQRALEMPPGRVADIAASFQHAAIDVLVSKTKLAIQRTGANRVVVAGGVAANRLLRERFGKELDLPVHMPPLSLCIDNGAMIAAAAHSRLRHHLVSDFRVTPNPNLPLDPSRS